MRSEGRSVVVWIARVAWAVLPLTAGALVADSLESWSTPARAVGATLSWLLWAIGLLALFVPRPIGLTVLRFGAPNVAVATLLLALTADAGGVVRIGGAASALVAGALALGRPVADACVNAAAYGDERRFPLRIPPPLLLTALPLAVLASGAAGLGAPLLLADGRWLPGALVLAAGGALTARLARSVHALSERFAVLVPAGLVVRDGLLLVDAVLFPREYVVALERPPGPIPPVREPSVLDTRLGAMLGTVRVQLARPAQIGLSRRRATELVAVDEVLLAPMSPGRMLETARRRRIPARDAGRAR